MRTGLIYFIIPFILSGCGAIANTPSTSPIAAPSVGSSLTKSHNLEDPNSYLARLERYQEIIDKCPIDVIIEPQSYFLKHAKHLELPHKIENIAGLIVINNHKPNDVFGGMFIWINSENRTAAQMFGTYIHEYGHYVSLVIDRKFHKNRGSVEKELYAHRYALNYLYVNGFPDAFASYFESVALVHGSENKLNKFIGDFTENFIALNILIKDYSFEKYFTYYEKSFSPGALNYESYFLIYNKKSPSLKSSIKK